jgi:hypothetical protein
MRKLKWILSALPLCVSGLGTTSCATDCPPPKPAFCDKAAPIYLEPGEEEHLSDRTLGEIEGQFALGHELCNWPTAR